MLDAVFGIIVLVGLLLAVFGLVHWSRRARDGDKAAAMGLYLLFGIPGGLLTVAGLALLVNGKGGGWLALALGFALGLPLVPQVRRLLARVLPMEPDSPIDLSGLCLILATLAVLTYSLLTTGGSEATVPELGTGAAVTALVINFLAFVGLAYIAVGYRNYRTAREATARLGLRKPTLVEIAVGLAAVFPAFFFSLTGSLLTSFFQPEVVDRLTETIDNMTTGVQNPLGALLLGLCTGIGEEVLFRGAIQPRFGILLTTLLWTALHMQYQLTWVIAGLVLMGIMLGLIRKNYGTVAAIITHAVYNVLVVILQMSVT